MKKTHLVIGTSAAGMGVLSRLRSLDPNSTILCISSSPILPYNTCLLADVLAGERDIGSAATRPRRFFEENDIELHLSTTICHVDTERKSITSTNGRAFSYDTLFIGTGTAPFKLPIEGIDAFDGVFSFHTMSDVMGILAWVERHNPKQAVVIGGGLSGVECADALAARGIASTVVELKQRLLPGLCDDVGSAFLLRRMRVAGTQVHTAMSVTTIVGDSGRVRGVMLDNGVMVKCDMVICAHGGQPNSAFASKAGIATHARGILVDEYMQTSKPGVYAGGDVAVVRDMVTGERVRSSLWPDAMQQGMCAARSMAAKKHGDEERPYPGVCMISSSRFYDMTFVSYGLVANVSDDCEKVTTRHDKNAYHTFFICDDYLVGFVMVGQVTLLGHFRGVVQRRERITKEDLYALVRNG